MKTLLPKKQIWGRSKHVSSRWTFSFISV